MDQTGLARAAIARLCARRFGRDVPTVELERELAAHGIVDGRFLLLMRELEQRRLALRTGSGWRLVSPPVRHRSPPAIASFAWIH